MNWQQLIDEVYEYWQTQDVSYGEVLEYARQEFGELGELAILLKNYNYQVENGGHMQYFDNGYCQKSGGCFSNKDYDIPLHLRMLELFIKFDLHNTVTGLPVFEIMNQFNVYHQEEYYEMEDDVCQECDGEGYLDEDGEEECCNCGGSGYETVEVWYDGYDEIDESLDNKYYEVNDAFIEHFDSVIEKSY